MELHPAPATGGKNKKGFPREAFFMGTALISAMEK